MKMAIRLNEFAEGLDDEITILDLKPRMKAELIEHSSIGPQNESPTANFLQQINARARHALGSRGLVTAENGWQGE
jgi:hypothetical protein